MKFWYRRCQQALLKQWKAERLQNFDNPYIKLVLKLMCTLINCPSNEYLNGNNTA